MEENRETGIDGMYQFEKAEKKLLSKQIEEELMNYILQEPLEVGQKLPNEFELAEKFGAGRSTVREAVKSLVSKGILEVRRGAGTFVVSRQSAEEDPLGLSKLDDKYKLALELFEVRLMLEPEIAALAAEHASPEELETLARLCDETEALYRSGKNHSKKDVEFHTCIAHCSKNRVVEMLIPIINTAIITFVNLTHRQLMQETLDTHRAILNAITDQDPVGARCAMIMHLTYNRQFLMKMMKRQ